MIRLFIALKLPPEIIEHIESLRKKVSDDNTKRWEFKDKLHITLKFLGNVEQEKLSGITDTLEKITAGKNKIKCEFDRFGFFKPRILWISITPDKTLYSIVDEIESGFEKLGFPNEEKKFKPHITLLRIKDKLDPDFVTAFEKFELPKRQFYSEDIALVKSELMRGGSVYTTLRNYKLL